MRRTPTGRRLAPPASARAAPASTTSVPRGSSAPAIQPLRAVTGFDGVRNQVQRRAVGDRLQRPLAPPVGDDHVDAADGCDLAGFDLGAHAAARQVRAGAARHRLDRRRDALDCRDVPRRRVARRRRRVEAVDVGEQHEEIGADHRRDARCEAVIVAVADLRGRDGVVLVDHRHGAHLEKLHRRRARVQVAPPLLGVGEGQQDLPGGDAVVRQDLGPDARQRNLADGRRGLALLELQRSGRKPQHRTPKRDRAGGDDEHVGAAPVQLGDVLGEGRRARHG